MDEFSLYGTIGAIILIQISFFWLFRYDHYTRKLSNDYMQSNQLVVILVGACQRHYRHKLDQINDAHDDAGHTADTNENDSELILIEKLRKQLESPGNNFKVLTVLLAPYKQQDQLDEQQQQQIIMKDGVVRLNSNEINYYHLKQVVNCIESQLTLESNLKLHAYIDIQQVLPPPSGAKRPFDLLDDLRNYCMPANGILFALKALIARGCSRIVFVRDWRYPLADTNHLGRDIYWQFYEQFDQNSIEFVDKSEHYQNSPASIQVYIQQRQNPEAQNYSLHKLSGATILNSIKSLSLLGDFNPKPPIMKRPTEIAGSSCDVAAAAAAGEEGQKEPKTQIDKRHDEISVIAARICELILLEHPRSVTVTI